MKNTQIVAGTLTAITLGCFLSGCSTNPYEPVETETMIQPPKLKAEALIDGYLIKHLPNGLNRVEVPAKDAGTPEDLPCLIINDKYFESATMSCDWDAAYGLRNQLKPPQP